MTDTSGGAPTRLSAPAIGYAGLMATVLVVLGLSTLPGVRPQTGVIAVFDDWLQVIGYVLATGAAVWRVVSRAERRLLWSLVAVALGLRTFGFIYTIVVLERAADFPSLADFSWVLSAVVLLAALLLAAYQHLPRHSPLLALDALLGGVTAAAVYAGLLSDQWRQISGPQVTSEAVATNIAYPLIDVALLVVAVGLLAATRGQLPLDTGALGVGVVVFAVVDSVFLYQVATGTFRPGSVLTPLALAGAMLIGLAGWFPSRTRARPARAPTPRGRSVPLVLALACVVVLARDAVSKVPAWRDPAGVRRGRHRHGAGLPHVHRRRPGGKRRAVAKDVELQRFQALVEASEDFIAIATVEGQVIYMNPAGRRMVGVPDDLDVTTTTVGRLRARAGPQHPQRGRARV